MERRADRADLTVVEGRRLVAFFCTGGAADDDAICSTAGGEADGEGEGEGVVSNGNTSGTPSSSRLTTFFTASDSSLVSASGASAK